MRRFAPVAVVAALWAASATAFEIRIRVPTRCRLRLSKASGSLLAMGRVLDDHGRGIAGAEVVFATRGAKTVTRRTDSRGRIQARLLGATRGQAIFSFAGTERYGGCVARVPFDLSRKFPRLLVDGPDVVRVGEVGRFDAWTDSPRASVRARIWRGKDWKHIAMGKPQPTGRWSFQIDIRAAGGPGPGTLRVEVLEDGHHNAAIVDRAVALILPTTLELRVDREAAEGDALDWSGRLTSPWGPVKDALVSVLGDGRLVATVQTDAAGRYRGAIPAVRLGRGVHHLQTAFSPTRSGMASSVSRGRKVTILPPSLFRGWMPILAAALSLLALAATLSLRRRPRTERRKAPERRPGPPAPKPSLRRVLRRLVQSRVVQGGVWDGPKNEPMAGALVRAGDQERIVTDAGGRFSVGPVEGSICELEVRAEGFATERITIELPQREDRWIVLWPWREKILRTYGQLAGQILPGPPLGRRTPIELLRDAESLPTAQKEAFAELTQIVLTSCYSPRDADENAWEQTTALVETLYRARSADPS